MSRNGQEKLFEGWLTKSPPIKRIWRGRWRRRWFSLQQSGDLPDQYVLMYYADRNCRKIKGWIDLDHCEQVDTGLKFEDKKIKFDYMFDIKTPSRTYYLAAENEQDMKTWVKYICCVCNLKATSDEEEVNILQGVVTKTENNVPSNEISSTNSALQSPPISPVSTSPYIPISECISGSIPFISPNDIKDCQALLQRNLQNSSAHFQTPNYMNNTYETSPTYLNFVQPNNLRSYDIPRLLQSSTPGHSTLKTNEEINYQNIEKMNQSPLQSPTDSESVFTDDDWSHNTTISTEKSNLCYKKVESSADLDVSVSKKFTKLAIDESIKLPELQQTVMAPPRPPKPQHIGSTNLTTFASKVPKDKSDTRSNFTEDINGASIDLDEMYDFPRSHEIESGKNVNRHCYNNAAPVSLDGHIFQYDVSPRPSTSGVYHFKYDDENSEEPASPISQSSSTRAYSNLPSPSLPDIQLMPPPIVNRGLKPKRKLSDSLSISSNPEQPSPRLAPLVDRHLKPLNLLPPKNKQRSIDSEDEVTYDNQSVALAANLQKSYDSVSNDIDETCDSSNHLKLEYLDLDLDLASEIPKPVVVNPARSPVGNTVYKEVDFMKTMAFNITRNNLEKERKETVPMLKK